MSKAIITCCLSMIVLAIPAKAEAHTITKAKCIKQANKRPAKTVHQWRKRVRKCRRVAKIHNRWHKRHVVIPYKLKRIRGCESWGDPHAKGNYQAQNSHSTASGAYQYLDSTWGGHRGYEKARYAPKWIQDKRAVRDFKNVGARPWYASRGCWR